MTVVAADKLPSIDLPENIISVRETFEIDVDM